MKASKWRRLGHIFVSEAQFPWMATHAMIPIADHLEGDVFRVYFSPRDRQNRGHGAYLDLELAPRIKVLRVHEKPVLEPGSLGCFDDSGALPNALVKIGNETLLYYTGINLGVTVSIRNSVGLARWNEAEEKFDRVYKGPVLDRTQLHPHFVATPEVHFENGVYRAWFTACRRWEHTNNGPKHFYNLEYCESDDGHHWVRDGTVALDFQDDCEYAIGVPRVIRGQNGYQMWFCSRASRSANTYRIRYAESADGKHFSRVDRGYHLDVAEEGWDSKMVCYPFVFDHRGSRYMLYNGNGYGKTGFGLAILENRV